MRNSNFIIAAALLALAIAAPSFATGVPNGAKIFIAPMDNGLDGFLAPEIIKKKVPVVIVTDETQAEYVLAGASLKADDKWYHTLFGGKDKNEGNVRLLDVKSKQLVWAAEAGDRSLWWGNLKRGGQRKVADRIVGKMKGDLFKK
jgi:hypothetical protein